MPTNKKQIGLSSQRTGQIGVNVVERIVLSEWKSRWQSLDAQNDDGVDGLIFLEQSGSLTGQVIYTQVKCRNYSKSKEHNDKCISLSYNDKKLAKHVDRWERLAGAAIIVHVDPNTFEARWVNIRDKEAFGKSHVLIPTNQFFDHTAKEKIADLCGTIHKNQTLSIIKSDSKDFSYLKKIGHTEASAKQFYDNLNNANVTFKDKGPQVRFLPEGWFHLTRPGRQRLARFQSFVLLGTVRKIINQSTPKDVTVVHKADANGPERVAITVAVTFSFRQTAIVKLVLNRVIIEGESHFSYNFHTIYEAQRRRDTIGVLLSRE